MAEDANGRTKKQAPPRWYGRFCVVDGHPEPLTYHVEGLELSPGQPVLLPLRTRTVVGVFMGEEKPPSFKTAGVLGLLSFSVPFPPVLLQMVQFVSQYYLTSLGRCISLLAPGFFWNLKKRESLETRLGKRFGDTQMSLGVTLPTLGKTEKIFLESSKKPFGAQNIKELNPDQKEAVDTILGSSKSVTLLEGVTGSGKTEVYIQSVLKILEQGKNALMMVPEIALTPQMTDRFRLVFGEQLALLHSGLEPTEYEKEWYRVLLGQCRIVLGVRTSIFAPLQNVGLIIVDEEHDSSYKTDEMPCVQARDLAVMRSHLEGAKCCLGSATPSLESFHNAQSGKYNYVKLKRSFSGNPTKVTIVDIRDLIRGKMNLGSANVPQRSSAVPFKGRILSDEIIEKIGEIHERKEQTMVIYNRRGYSTFSMCCGCNTPLTCPKCSVTTTLHRGNTVEICHYCSSERKLRTVCPACGGTHFNIFGAGTQSIEEELLDQIPGIKVARLDRDVLTSQKRLRQVIDGFRKKEFDVLVGTQILAKGHDFPNVTLVVIVHVEDGLFMPDFRAAERTFQLICQSAGRSGRGSLAGQVCVQSLVPEHPVLLESLRRDLMGFRSRELPLRCLQKLPPYYRQIMLEFKGKNLDQIKIKSQELARLILEFWKTQSLDPSKAILVGPHPAPVERINDFFRIQMCVSFLKTLHPQQILGPVLSLWKSSHHVGLRVDVDPHSFQ